MQFSLDVRDDGKAADGRHSRSAKDEENKKIYFGTVLKKGVDL